MDELVAELARALRLRAEALRERVDRARGMTPPGQVAYRQALDVLAQFPPAVADVLERELDDGHSEAGMVSFIQRLLRHTLDVTLFADRWLFGSPRIHDEQSLLFAIKNECETLSLGSRQPIVVPGDADNFRTLVAESQDVLFSPLRAIGWTSDLPTTPRFAFIQVPEYEGRHGPWRPIVLGHELAHLAVIEHDSVARLDLAATLDLRSIPVENGAPEGYLRFLEIAEAWATELLCDAHAIRRFGPAGLASLGEFLTVVGALSASSATHPPAALRLHFMVEWLGEVPSTYRSIVGPWTRLASTQPPPGAPAWLQELIAKFLGLGGEIHALASWAERYDAGNRQGFVEHVRQQLVDGVPGALRVKLGDATASVSDADVVNAGWLARAADPQVPINELVAKNLDTLSLVDRWTTSGGKLEVITLEEDRGHEAPPVASTLGRQELEQRLVRTDELGLTVTPLLEGSLGPAGVDVRLGNRFIVFQRSGTARFDPLAKEDDPRSVQREIVRPWGDEFVLHPGELVLATTIEYLRLPRDLTGQVITRSSYGRLGLITATAVQINPGFRGCLTLELVNLGEVPLRLTPGERIAQLTFSPTTAEQSATASKYDCPTGPQFSAVQQDPDAEVLRAMRSKRD